MQALAQFLNVDNEFLMQLALLIVDLIGQYLVKRSGCGRPCGEPPKGTTPPPSDEPQPMTS